MFVRHMLVASAAMILSTIPASAGPVVYAVSNNFNNFTGEFGTLDLTTGTFSQIGPVTSDLPTGLAPGPNGGLLTFDQAAGTLDSIDPATGVLSVVGAIPLVTTNEPGNEPYSIAELNGTVYMTDLYGNLYTLNPTTGASTLIGLTGIPICPSLTSPVEVSDEALFTANGKLYVAFDGVNLVTSAVVDSPELYQINPTTGVATLVGPTALGIDAAVQVNGTVYGLDFGYAASNTVLSLNLANGNTTFLNDYVSSPVPDGVNSFDIQGVSATPEPASIILIFGGLLMMGANRKLVRQPR